MNKGLTNFQVDKFFQNQGNEEIMKNYMGVCSMESITRYINFYEIIKPKMVNVLFQYLIRTNITNQEQTGGILWIFIPKKLIFI